MIEVKHDHKLEFPTIEVPMIQEDDENPHTGYQQSKIDGILIPLIRYNNYTIWFPSIERVVLKCGQVPTISVTFNDSFGQIKPLDTPGIDSILYVQILPPFDNAYKKIQLAFRVTRIKMRGSVVSISGTYCIPRIFDNVMKPYGFLSTYDLFDKVSNEYGLGFCSNVSGTTDDRYIYNPNMNLLDFLSREIVYSGLSEGEDADKHVFGWWIDLWNNINLVDLFDAYTKVVPDEELLIWLSSNTTNDASVDLQAEPQQQIAAFCNHPIMASNDLFVMDYIPKANNYNGTDINFEVYMLDNLDRHSTLIQDGDVKEKSSTTIKYKYGGEVFGDFDYLTKQATRDLFINKINGQTIEVQANRPLLGLMKGGRVNFWWFDTNNPMISDIDTSEIESNIALPPDIFTGDTEYKINPTVSGQYYICDITYTYDKLGGWVSKYILSRPADKINRVNAPSKETFMT